MSRPAASGRVKTQAAQALLARADRITFDPIRLVYVADGALVDQALVGELLESGALVRVPWTARLRAGEVS